MFASLVSSRCDEKYAIYINSMSSKRGIKMKNESV